MFPIIHRPMWLNQMIYKEYVWRFRGIEKSIFLTFDDGPHPTITDTILDQLKQYDAKATFFCIGKNVNMYPHIYNRILQEGHSVGNHTQNHLDGRLTTDMLYFEDIQFASVFIKSNLFRPPWGSLTKSKAKYIQESMKLKIVMWSVESGDHNINLTPQECWKNIESQTKLGSILLLHDSENAYENVRNVLPKLLEHYSNKGHIFKSIVI